MTPAASKARLTCTCSEFPRITADTDRKEIQEETINIIQQDSTLTSNMTKRKIEWSELTIFSDSSDDAEAKKPVKRPQRNKNTQTSTNPDPNVPDVEPSEDLHDEEPPEAESSHGEDTISDPGGPETNDTTEEEPVENAPGPQSSQPESNTGSGQGGRICGNKPCKRPAAPGYKQCYQCRKYGEDKRA
ncbi:hypothetical protein FPCIR_4271 [Fusarium pseudocircinatum]|uniref:Uncharacterized protein n=1 Tax=Fusarium pseudocircinatum TaxID=56676 RepID=A0A8H5PFP1_9HYPO|nr:hypothetical protein FPCIR_4271 [Fusarium pseudocircinatum]